MQSTPPPGGPGSTGSPLDGVPLFEGLSGDALSRILATSEMVRTQPGEVLFREGDEGDAFYVVLEGSIELAKASAAGGYERLAVMKAGDCFGEMALVIDVPRSATARSLEPAELLAISRQAFHEMVGSGVAFRLLRNVSRSLWATSIRFAARQRAAIDAEAFSRDVSRVIQRRIQPDAPPTAPGYQIAGAIRLHDVGSGSVSWDWLQLSDGRLVLAVARVDGEGLPAGHHLALLRAVLHEAAESRSDLSRILARASRALGHGGAGSTEQRVHCALMALGAGEIEWVSAGRISATVVGPNGSKAELSSSNTPLGAPDFVAETGTVTLAPGDTVVCLSAAADEALRAAETAVASGSTLGTGELLGEVLRGVGEALEGDRREAAAVIVRWTS